MKTQDFEVIGEYPDGDIDELIGKIGDLAHDITACRDVCKVRSNAEAIMFLAADVIVWANNQKSQS